MCLYTIPSLIRRQILDDRLHWTFRVPSSDLKDVSQAWVRYCKLCLPYLGLWVFLLPKLQTFGEAFLYYCLQKHCATILSIQNNDFLKSQNRRSAKYTKTTSCSAFVWMDEEEEDDGCESKKRREAELQRWWSLPRALLQFRSVTIFFVTFKWLGYSTIIITPINLSLSCLKL